MNVKHCLDCERTIRLSSDKGRVTVVMDKSDYHKKMDTLVNDKNTYKKLKNDPSKKLQRKLNKTPAKAFTPPAEKKIGTRWSFVEKIKRVTGLYLKMLFTSPKSKRLPIWNKVTARNINFLLNNLIHYLSP